ncbi:hypothetical protein ARMGADRAFT_1085063 [Armillaria gallica]|uniref:Uncharacterized protein n=1 Tax=Armillaria gallica TaxID=47427 RepID=A0A2H3CYK4_ARMGA|nr:hypothetical protein ARMGADRAFT_1085063 [Armillaria gallica]
MFLRTTTKWKKKALAKHVKGKRATETLILLCVSACYQPSLAWLLFPFWPLGFFVLLEVTFTICSEVPGNLLMFDQVRDMKVVILWLSCHLSVDNASG